MSVLNWVISAAKAVSAWQHREQAYGELRALDDHSLADIGLHRSQITALLGGIDAPDPFVPPQPVRARKFAKRQAA
jgi:uncharacterized protein YjiS (DUF1127 family)